MYLTPQTHPDGTIHTPSSSPVTELSGSHPHLLPPLPVTECGKLNKEAADKLKKKFNIPSVDLQYDSISTMMAARLATSLVSHVLFLKNQVPLYVHSPMLSGYVLTISLFLDPLYNSPACP